MTRRRIWTLIVTIGVALSICIAGALIFLFSLPKGCNQMTFQVGCAKVDGEVYEWQGNSVDYVIEDISYMRHIASVIRTLHYQKTEDAVKDVQLLTFFYQAAGSHEEREALWSVSFAYDFYQQKIYALKDGVWYRVSNTKRMESIISTLLDHSLRFSDECWRGQSTFAFEEHKESDFDSPTFRYHLYWMPEKRPTYEEHGFRNSGFSNTEPTVIQSAEDAIWRAANELGYQNPVAVTFYDETCGYWMVELYDDKGEDWTDVNAYTRFLHENVQTVIMNREGVTLEIYRSVTRYTPFIEEIIERGTA